MVGPTITVMCGNCEFLCETIHNTTKKLGDSDKCEKRLCTHLDEYLTSPYVTPDHCPFKKFTIDNFVEKHVEEPSDDSL